MGSRVLEFSPDGKLFAYINNHGILTIWDTETNELKQEYTPNLHLTSPCTSLTWIVVNTQKRTPKAKKARKSFDASHGNQLYLAFGTSKGGVALYSYSSAKIERNFNGEGHSSRVLDIINDNGDYIYTCGEDGKIIVWSISEEKQINSWAVGNEKPHCLLYLPESKSLLVGCRQLKQYSVESQELLNTFIGHSSEVTLLTSFVHDDTEYVLSGSKMDSLLSLWAVKKSSKYRNAVAKFLMEDVANYLSCRIVNEDILQVASTTRSGAVHFYVKNLDKLEADKPIKPKVTIEVVSEHTSSVEPVPTLSASLKYNNNKDEILLGYGDSHVLTFERLAPTFTEKRQILVRNNSKKLPSKGANKKAEGNLKVLVPIVSSNDVEYQSTATVSRKSNKTIEIPMETRLENISINKGEAPHAQSKVQLLVQGLRNQDPHLLRTVLSQTDPKVIELTLQKLPVQYVGSLVTELTSLMQKKTTNVQIATAWFKVLVRTHSSQLMALGKEELFDRLGPCLGLIEHKQNFLKELSRIQGRLELLINQIKTNTEEENLKNDNLLVYVDADSSNSDAEDENAYNMESSSGEEWAGENDTDEEMDVSEKE